MLENSLNSEKNQRAKCNLTFEARSRGGRKPASDLQKLAARAAILKSRAWEKSTGPQTPEGKHKSAQNRKRHKRSEVWKWRRKGSKQELDLFSAQINAAIAELQQWQKEQGSKWIPLKSSRLEIKNGKNSLIVKIQVPEVGLTPELEAQAQKLFSKIPAKFERTRTETTVTRQIKRKSRRP